MVCGVVVWERAIKNGLRIDIPQGCWAEHLSRRCWLRLCVVALKKRVGNQAKRGAGRRGCIMKQQEPLRVRESRSSDMRRHASLRGSMVWGGSGWLDGMGRWENTMQLAYVCCLLFLCSVHTYWFLQAVAADLQTCRLADWQTPNPQVGGTMDHGRLARRGCDWTKPDGYAVLVSRPL